MTKAEHDDPPLKSEKGFLHGPDGLPRLVITRRRRGFLRDVELRKIEEKRHDLPIKPDGRVALLSLCEELRHHLDSVDLPTDKWPVTPIELDGGYDPEEHGVVADEDLWIEYVEDSTEPLTKNRIVADLLHTVVRLCAICSDEQLRDVFKAMNLFHLNSTVGELNGLALAGDAAKKAREMGPRARRERAERLRKLILAIAREFWRCHPKLEGQPFNTSKKIAQAVNNARELMEPGCAPLSPKTIADHLRLALQDELSAAEARPEMANSEI